MTNLALWLQEMSKDHNFISFMKIIQDKADVVQQLALNQGDTEFLKGKYDALKWASDLPITIIEQSKQDADTADTSS